MSAVNIVLLLFVLFMAYWWSAQGLFSSLLHLVSVIVAGTLALALWEPIVLGLLMKWDRCAPYAWGVGLGIPFVAWLLLVRLGFDKLIGMNVNFNPIVSMVGGGALGFVAGLLTGGLMVISVNYLPLGPTFMGYQPLQIAGNGQVEPKPGGGLWIAADAFAEKFFSRLSVGAFSTATPLRNFEPDLARRAREYRVHQDENAAVVALPGTVSVTTILVAPVAELGLPAEVSSALGLGAGNAGARVVFVETSWNRNRPGTFDGDQTIRVASTQIRLTSLPRGYANPTPVLHAPVAVLMSSGEGGGRRLVAFNEDDKIAYGINQEEQFGWVFVLPESEEQLQWVFVRQLRFQVKEPKKDAEELTSALRGAEVEVADVHQEPVIGERVGPNAGQMATEIIISNKLFTSVAASKVPDSIELNEKFEIVSGRGVVKRSTGYVQKTTVEYIKIPNPRVKKFVRVTLTKESAGSTLGRATVAAASVTSMHLRDSSGNLLEAVAYAWWRNDGSQDININYDRPFAHPIDVPVRQMGANDRIYLFFLANIGVDILEFRVGNTTQQVNNLRVE